MMKPQLSITNRDVFINCPFDAQYVPILQAIVFAVHYAGFIARSALDNQNVGKIRLTKIIQLIKECEYGLHDLSRVEAGSGKLPRFNMPFELGLFIGCMEFGSKAQKSKQILILDGKPYHSKKTLSDIAGLDPQPHKNDPEESIRLVSIWLRRVSKNSSIPGGTEMVKRYRSFKCALPAILKAHKISASEIKKLEFYNDYRDFVVAWLEKRRR